ncbi:MAG: hypothetical protein NTW07_01230 [candidate division Zixibacteria bacterium]|nr:hypothetical protein [candidate division Zixibacteria bacterium]
MMDIVVSFFSGVFGAVVGGLCTWHVTTRVERNKARLETLLRAAEALQDYKVDYANWYVEYLSPLVEAKGHWERPSTGSPDPEKLRLMSAADKGRGRLKVVHGALFAHFPKDVVKPLCTEIMKIILMTCYQAQVDCREVDRVADGASDLIPDLIRKYASSRAW